MLIHQYQCSCSAMWHLPRRRWRTVANLDDITMLLCNDIAYSGCNSFRRHDETMMTVMMTLDAGHAVAILVIQVYQMTCCPKAACCLPAPVWKIIAALPGFRQIRCHNFVWDSTGAHLASGECDYIATKIAQHTGCRSVRHVVITVIDVDSVASVSSVQRVADLVSAASLQIQTRFWID